MTRKLVFNMRTLLLFLHVIRGGFFLTLLFASSSTLAQGQVIGRWMGLSIRSSWNESLLLLQKIVSFGHLLLSPAVGRKTPIASV